MIILLYNAILFLSNIHILLNIIFPCGQALFRNTLDKMAPLSELIFRDSRNFLRLSLSTRNQIFNPRNSTNYQRYSIFCTKSSTSFQCSCKRSISSSSLRASATLSDSKDSSQLNQSANTSSKAQAKPQIIRANVPLVFVCPHLIRKRAADTATSTLPSEPLCTNSFTAAELQEIRPRQLRRTSLLSSYMKLAKFRLSGKLYDMTYLFLFCFVTGLLVIACTQLYLITCSVSSGDDDSGWRLLDGAGGAQPASRHTRLLRVGHNAHGGGGEHREPAARSSLRRTDGAHQSASAGARLLAHTRHLLRALVAHRRQRRALRRVQPGGLGSRRHQLRALHVGVHAAQTRVALEYVDRRHCRRDSATYWCAFNYDPLYEKSIRALPLIIFTHVIKTYYHEYSIHVLYI